MDTEHIVIYEAAYKYSAKNVKLKIKYHWQNVNNNPKYSNHHQIIKKKGPGFKNCKLTYISLLGHTDSRTMTHFWTWLWHLI